MRRLLAALLGLAALLVAMTWVGAAPPEARRSGFDDMGPTTQALQRDDTQNPAMLWVQEGADLWTRRVGVGYKSCASCHDDATKSMRGVAARYPRFDAQEKRAVDLGERIQLCRQRHQLATPFPPESEDLLSLAAYIGFQSRGMPIVPDDDPRLAPAAERGQKLFVQRIGQLDLACAQCHVDLAGRKLGGSTIPQAHPTGYPIYRLDWQAMGSLQRRLRACMTGVRAEPYPFAAQEWVDLELYLTRRAAGMTVETPAVRP